MEANQDLRDVVLYMMLQPRNWRDISTPMHHEAKRSQVEWEVYRFQSPRPWLVFTESIFNRFKDDWNLLPDRPKIVEHQLNYAEIIPEFSDSEDEERFEIEPIANSNVCKNIIKKKRGVY